MSSTLIILIAVIMVVLTTDVSVLIGVAELISTVPAYLPRHPIPIIIELWCVLFIHLSKNVVFFCVVAHSLLDYFAALSVKHTFMRHFLVTICLVIIHLVTFGDAFTVSASCTFSFGLVDFTHWFTVRTHLCYIAV